MRLNSESKLFKLSACCFLTAWRTPAALGGNPLSPGVPHGAAGVTRVPSDGRTLDALSSGIPRSEATFPHRAAKLQAAPERLITADKHPPERRSAPTPSQEHGSELNQSCNHKLHTNLPNCTQNKLSRLEPAAASAKILKPHTTHSASDSCEHLAAETSTSSRKKKI